MFLIICPFCGERDQSEFKAGGERWNHVHGCRKWFNIIRDTTNDKIKAVYKMGEKPPLK